MSGATIRTVREIVEREVAENLHELDPEEAAVMVLLRERLAADEEQAKAS